MVLSAAVGRIIGRPIGRILGAGDTFDVNFTLGAMPAIFTFTRASTSTYFDFSGVLQTATDDTPRFDHTFNGTSWEPAGLLIEGSRTNNFLRSFEFENAFWVKARTTVGAGRFNSPLGTSTARLVEISDIALGDKRIYRNSMALLPTSNQCASFVVKKQNLRYCAVTIGEGSNITHSVRAGFDLDTGAVTTTSVSGSGVLSGSGVINLGGGWYRIWVSGAPRTSGTTCSSWLILRETSGDTIEDFTGTLGDGVYVAQGQFETGNFPSSMIETTGSAATRSSDICTTTNLAVIGFNASEGTALVEFNMLGKVGTVINYRFLAFTDNSTNNNLRLSTTNNQNNAQGVVVSGGVSVASFTDAAVNINTNYKITLAYKVDDFAFCTNGGLVATDTGGVVPTGIDRMQVGHMQSAGQPFSYIRRIVYYPTRLSDAKLQEITS